MQATMQASLDALIAALPPSVQSHLRAALAGGLDKLQPWMLFRAFDAAGFPEGNFTPGSAEELTPVQRLLAELPLHGVATPVKYALPSDARTARRWLGLDMNAGLPDPCDRPIELEQEGRSVAWPLWQVMQALSNDVDAMAAVFGGFSSLEAAQCFVALARSGYDFAASMEVLKHGDRDVLAELGPEAASWARMTADDWFAERASAKRRRMRNQDAIETVLAVALARSGETEDEHFDSLLPTNTCCPPAFSIERLRSIPEPRRLPAALAALARVQPPDVIIEYGLAMLEVLRAPEIAQIVGDTSKTSDVPPKSWVRAELERLGMGKTRSRARAAELLVLSTLRPRDAKALGSIAQQQLRIAGKAWDNRDLPAAHRFEAGDAAFVTELELRVLGDASGPRYDAWLLGGDSGTIFATGTTRRVAVREQKGIEPVGRTAAAVCDAIQEACNVQVPRISAAKARAGRTRR
jgi:hypothetical protein